MKNEYIYKVGGLPFAVRFPEGEEMEALLPSFRPFRCGECAEDALLFRLHVYGRAASADEKGAELLGESSNDMGHVRLLRNADGYRIEIDYEAAGEGVHAMDAGSGFRRAEAHLLPGDPFAGTALSSMLRILYAQAVLGRNGVSIHASCVCAGGKAYLFLGKSGTGKSTHARQWMQAFPDCSLLNDDNPVVRMEEGRAVAYGTPWSGKTPCYKNERHPVAGIARLQQAGANRFVPLTAPEAFMVLLPSCSAIRQDERLQDALHVTLIRMAEQLPVARMECLPCREAAVMCREGLDRITASAR